jgi:hypothetical protein
MWWFKRRPIREGFPEGFTVQRIGVSGAKDLADLPPGDIANYFRQHPEVARDLLNECADKRYTPSTFILDDFTVGWLSRSPLESKCVRRFTNLADAATDYLLFSLGKSRWNPPSSN